MREEYDNKTRYGYYRELAKASIKRTTVTDDSLYSDQTNFIPWFFWYPLEEIKEGIPAVAFDHDFFEEDDDRMEALKDIFRIRNIKSVIVVPEQYTMYKRDWLIDDNDEDIDLLFYSEQYIFNESHDWLVYSSHEATITFAGEWLVKEILNRFGEDNLCKRFYSKR